MDQRISQWVDFKIQEQSHQRVVADLVISPDLPSFEGHFPGDPILPAVSIIDVSLYLLSQVENEISHSDIEIKRSKFMAMVRPNQKVKIVAESDDGQNWRVSWKDHQDQSKMAQVHLVV